MDAFNFFFKETPHGIFIAHCYQYQPGRSTWVMETDPETFKRAGLDTHRRGGVGAIPRRRVRRGTGRPQADHQPLAVAQLPDHPLRALDRRQHRADRRRQGDRAFLDRLGHQARDGGRHRALRGVPLHRRARRQDGAGALRVGAARGGREDPAFRRRVAGLVRARQAVLGHGPDALRLRADDALARRSPTTIWRCARRSSSSSTDKVVARDAAGAGLRGRHRRARARRCSSRSGCAT